MQFVEKIDKPVNSLGVAFITICCSKGKVQLPFLKDPSDYFNKIMFDRNVLEYKKFMENISSYNMIFSFTSIGGKVNRTTNNNRNPYIHRLDGQNYHLVGSLLLIEGYKYKFAQLYIHDIYNKKIENKISASRYNLFIDYRCLCSLLITNFCQHSNMFYKLII